MADVVLPFEGVPSPWWIPLAVGLVVIVAMLAWTCVLFVRARHAWQHAPDAPEDAAHAFTWVFLVPALNEEVTIADSVSRLLELAIVTALVLAITGTAPFIGSDGWLQIAFIYVLAFAGTMLGAIASREEEGWCGWIKGFLIGHVYALYTWFLWPVLIRSTVRQLTERRDWAKTEREPLEIEAAPDPALAAERPRERARIAPGAPRG